MTREELDFIGSMNMCDEISNEAYKKIVCHCREQEPCEDVINRQAVLDIVNNPLNIRLDEIIKKLPPVNPQPKTGHWIRISPAEIYECSECGQNVMTSDICAYRFCHGCGAKMVESPESEEG